MNISWRGEQQNEVLCCASHSALLDDLDTHTTLDHDDDSPFYHTSIKQDKYYFGDSILFQQSPGTMPTSTKSHYDVLNRNYNRNQTFLDETETVTGSTPLDLHYSHLDDSANIPPAIRLFAPISLEKTDSRNKRATTPEQLQLPIPLSPLDIDRLLNIPELEYLDALGEESRGMDSNQRVCSGALSTTCTTPVEIETHRPLDNANENDNSGAGTNTTRDNNECNTRLAFQREQRIISTTTSSNNLVAPPLKKQRMADAYHHHCHHLLQQDSPEQSQKQQEEHHLRQQHQHENQSQSTRRTSLTGPDDLSMELNYSSSTSTGASDTGLSSASIISIGSKSVTVHHQYTELVPSTSTATKKTQKRDLVTMMGGFPLPSPAKTNENTTENANANTSKDESSKNGDTTAAASAFISNGVDFVVKKAPSLKSFRRQWEWLATQTGHKSELQLSDSERRQLFCESFAREITRRPNAHTFYSQAVL